MNENGIRQGKHSLVKAFAALVFGCAATAAMAAGPSVSIEGTPTPAETAAIRHALGNDYADMAPFAVGHVDLNGDNKPDLIARAGGSGSCGSGGCDTAVLLATMHGYQPKWIYLSNAASDLIVLPMMHSGMHDFKFVGRTHPFAWIGATYR